MNRIVASRLRPALPLLYCYNAQGTFPDVSKNERGREGRGTTNTMSMASARGIAGIPQEKRGYVQRFLAHESFLTSCRPRDRLADKLFPGSGLTIPSPVVCWGQQGWRGLECYPITLRRHVTRSLSTTIEGREGVFLPPPSHFPLRKFEARGATAHRHNASNIRCAPDKGSAKVAHQAPFLGQSKGCSGILSNFWHVLMGQEGFKARL
nr:hypothetical protein CFP56_39002 [Quercus suber]